LLSQNALTARDLQEETLLFSDRCGGFAQRLSEIAPYPFHLQRCSGATAQMLDLVTAGFGVALLSEHLGFSAPLIMRPFHEPELKRRILLVSVAGRPLNPAAASFVKLCRARSFT
jgi:DNA-binding transcriptional LysR family regulator